MKHETCVCVCSLCVCGGGEPASLAGNKGSRLFFLEYGSLRQAKGPRFGPCAQNRAATRFLDQCLRETKGKQTRAANGANKQRAKSSPYFPFKHGFVFLVKGVGGGLLAKGKPK